MRLQLRYEYDHPRYSISTIQFNRLPRETFWSLKLLHILALIDSSHLMSWIFLGQFGFARYFSGAGGAREARQARKFLSTVVTSEHIGLTTGPRAECTAGAGAVCRCRCRCRREAILPKSGISRGSGSLLVSRVRKLEVRNSGTIFSGTGLLLGTA